MSSKFSRRPRIQPTPPICKKPRTPVPIPPTPPTWPPTTIVAAISWHGPFFPGQTYDIESLQDVHYDDALTAYHADTPTWPEWARWNLQLDIPNERANLTMTGYYQSTAYFDASKADIPITPNEPIDLLITSWDTQPPDHEIAFSALS